jgi:putative endonuclease
MAEKTQKQQVGQIGEDIAGMFLVKHGFKVISSNYRKKFGEIDLICKKNKKTHFVEVKTVSRETLDETFDSYRPEDNVHPTKLKRIARTIQAYVFEHDLKDEWQFDVVTVVLHEKTKTARVRILSDLIL